MPEFVNVCDDWTAWCITGVDIRASEISDKSVFRGHLSCSRLHLWLTSSSSAIMNTTSAVRNTLSAVMDTISTIVNTATDLKRNSWIDSSLSKYHTECIFGLHLGSVVHELFSTHRPSVQRHKSETIRHGWHNNRMDLDRVGIFRVDCCYNGSMYKNYSNQTQGGAPGARSAATHGQSDQATTVLSTNRPVGKKTRTFQLFSESRIRWRGWGTGIWRSVQM